LTETEKKIVREVDGFFAYGGIELPARMFSDLLNALSSYVEGRTEDYPREFICRLVADAAVTLASLSTLYDLHVNRKQYTNQLNK
jgi:hypothetical protein